MERLPTHRLKRRWLVEQWREDAEAARALYSDALAAAEAALAAYRMALGKNPGPWQISSMFQQAIQVAELRGDEETSDRLRALFRERPA